jgi:uncharacterized membrane protein YciS (DUF1049 family)
MRLIKRLFELAVFLFFISLFMMNKDVVIDFNYFGLKQPVKLAFWELVTISASIGIIVAAIGDFLSQIKWLAERRRLQKQANEHQQVVDGLNARIEELEADNDRLKNELELRPPGIDSMLAGAGTEQFTPDLEGTPEQKQTFLDSAEEATEMKREPFKDESSFGSLASVDDYHLQSATEEFQGFDQSVESSEKNAEVIKHPEDKEKKDK